MTGTFAQELMGLSTQPFSLKTGSSHTWLLLDLPPKPRTRLAKAEAAFGRHMGRAHPAFSAALKML